MQGNINARECYEQLLDRRMEACAFFFSHLTNTCNKRAFLCRTLYQLKKKKEKNGSVFFFFASRREVYSFAVSLPPLHAVARPIPFQSCIMLPFFFSFLFLFCRFCLRCFLHGIMHYDTITLLFVVVVVVCVCVAVLVACTCDFL